jgi:hypothetical protein
LGERRDEEAVRNGDAEQNENVSSENNDVAGPQAHTPANSEPAGNKILLSKLTDIMLKSWTETDKNMSKVFSNSLMRG